MSTRELVARHRDVVVDVLIGVVLYALLAAFLDQLGEIGMPAPWLEQPGLAAGALATLPLAIRRRLPLTALALVASGVIWFRLLGGCCETVTPFAMMIAIYSAGAYGRRVARDVLRVLGGGGVLAVMAVMLLLDAPEAGMPDLRLLNLVGALAPAVVFFGAAWFLGDQVRLRRDNEHQLMERTAELQLERHLNAERAAIDERLRIARELHDALGHHVSTMGVQAAGAERILERDPRRARGALEAIQESSRRAVQELQHTLRLLRDNGEESSSPVRLALVEHLADEVRGAGVEVTVERGDPLPRLPESVDLAATRVIQEALTNVLRHAGPGTSAWVQVGTDDGWLHVSVEDDGGGRPDPDLSVAGSGNGLAGLRERVELHDGVFEAEPHDGGGFRVAARLPLSEAGQEPAGMIR